LRHGREAVPYADFTTIAAAKSKLLRARINGIKYLKYTIIKENRHERKMHP